VLWGQSVVQYLSADLATAVKTSEELLQWAEGRGHLREIVIAHRSLGHTLTHWQDSSRLIGISSRQQPSGPGLERRRSPVMPMIR
jgi:hypothetical protein